ncbi:ABC transporter permease [Myroides marinus]|uniref:ABC transporter permease n=1 Tax=Myroides marinus TaxID=703342 RepID=UPI00257867B2|nr:ABC transporter permease [Myroides marinus]MDM1533848.1 ABC transporter permease [Myroides marinus]MDM1540801.1 ABC transporter permease [Myroides marinus]
MTIRKEFLLLIRDFGGLAILFVMPVFLVITVTLIQNNTYENITNQKMEILLVDLDRGEIANKLVSEVKSSGTFKFINTLDNNPLTEQTAKEAVRKGQYQLAIVIPKHLSSSLTERIDGNVNRVLAHFVDGDTLSTTTPFTPKEVKLYFDPALQTSFKEGIKGAIDKIVATIENKTIYSAFASQLSESDEPQELFTQENLISFKEIAPKDEEYNKIPNAVQHNVPAWSLFAIFFIIVPLSMNIVKEKNQGTNIRLYTMPTSPIITLGGKVITYLVICLLQFYLIILVGKFVFPLIGLASFEFSSNLLGLTVVTLFSGLAAVSLGVLLGTIAKTQEQSSPFGATFVVILAAVSGVWVPTFAMPSFMQYIAKVSPMNWALEGYYTILLRDGGIWQTRYMIILLLLFSLLILLIALFYDKKKRSL